MAAAHRIRPLEAHRAMRALLANPDDTEQAFRVVSALSGNSSRRGLRRFRRTAAGARILRENTNFIDLLTDDERMAAMPQGSVGAALRDYFTSEQISPGGLAEASEAAFAANPAEAGDGDELDPELRLYGQRLRDLHDVFHVLTGYGRDLRGEAAVLAFSVPQTRNPGVAYIVWSALRRVGFRSEMGQLIREALRRGLRSAWLPGQDWENLLARPLAEVRSELRIGPPPQYEAMRSEGAPRLAAGA